MATYKYVKRADGGKQRAMVLANGRLKFVKNTSGGHAPRKATKPAMATKKKNRKSTAMTHSKRRTHSPARQHKKTTRRRRHGGGGSIASTSNLLHVGGATLGLAFLLGPQSPIPSAAAYADKIPGSKTFGRAAVVGGAALAIDRFIWKNKWLKLAGVAGIVLAAAKVGEQGSNFKFVGDDEYTGDIDDVGDDYDVGDDDGDVGDDEE